MCQTQQIKFFNTEADITNNHSQYFERKTQLGSYVSKLDFHINKACILQEKTLNRKKYNLINALEKMKGQIFKESERTKKMKEYFYEHCEKILQEDVSKWDYNKDFFNNMFQLYDNKVREKRVNIDMQKEQIERKSLQLKQMMKNTRKEMTIQRLSQKLAEQKQQKYRQESKTKSSIIDTSNSQVRSKRVKTQVTLPSLTKVLRVKTVTDQTEVQMRNYMKPIKTEKLSIDPQVSQELVQMLSWYRDSRQSQCTWFQKLIFVDRNFKKIIQVLKSK